MTGRGRVVLVAGAAIAALLLVGWLLWGGHGTRPDTSTGSAPDIEPSGPEVAITLYFPSLSDRRLHGEERSIPQASREERVRAIVEALVSGPRSPMLVAPLPGEVELAGIFFSEGGVVYLDLHQPGQERPPAFGSLQELLVVFSLVDSVVLNSPGVDSVVLLWNGIQQPSFSGHVDTARPLRPNRKLLAEAP